MRLLRLQPHIPLALPPIAMTIGNFDGVHLGHQALIRQLQQVATQHQLKTAVMLFEPQPLEFFLAHRAPPRITSLREKLYYLRQLNLDYVILVKFDAEMQQKTAHEFAELLKSQLNVQHLVLGDDFHFGKHRQGNREFLQHFGFAVSSLNTLQQSGERISSTRIRQVLQQGDFALAQQLLGRPYSIMGRVVRGDQIGRTLDFPTANIALKRHQPCLHGIYAVDVRLLHGDLVHNVQQLNPQQAGILGYSSQHLFGAGHVGTRPAIAQAHPEWRLEIHFPQLSADLYGMLMEVRFLHYLHGEKQYHSLDELKIGIQHDVQQLCQYRQQHQHLDFLADE